MGMIFNTANTLEIIRRLNYHFSPGTNFANAAANDPGHLTTRGNSTYQKSHNLNIDLDDTIGSGNWKRYLTTIIDATADTNHQGNMLGDTIIAAVLNYLGDKNYVGIQFFANYSTTPSVTLFSEPAPGGKLYGSILVTSLSLDEALAEQRLARRPSAAKKGPRSGVQAPATGRRKKPEA